MLYFILQMKFINYSNSVNKNYVDVILLTPKYTQCELCQKFKYSR